MSHLFFDAMYASLTEVVVIARFDCAMEDLDKDLLNMAGCSSRRVILNILCNKSILADSDPIPFPLE